MQYNIIVAGVGGQGTILAGKILADVGILAGYDVKISEIHGMAQRGGSVITHVKFADKVYSPLIEEGEADYVVAFEMLEALRRLPFLKAGGEILVNTQEIEPMSVITGRAEYPKDIVEILESKAKLTKIDALDQALRLGSARVLNVIMLGYLAARMKIDKKHWLQALQNLIKAEYLDINIRAFNAGYEV